MTCFHQSGRHLPNLKSCGFKSNISCISLEYDVQQLCPFLCVFALPILTSHGSAALYVVKVLRGAPPADTKKGKVADGAAAAASEVCLNILLTVPGVDGNVAGGSLGLSWLVFGACVQLEFMGGVDVARVSSVFREALSAFMSRRKSPLTTQMFIDLFNRFPVSTAVLKTLPWRQSPASNTACFAASAGSVREPFGHRRGVHHLRGPSAPTGTDVCASEGVLVPLYVLVALSIVGVMTTTTT